MSLKLVFKNLNDINSVLPELFVTNVHSLKDADWISWFKTAPKFTSVRVNTLEVSSQDVIAILTEQLRKTADIYGKKVPDISVHRFLPDCLIVSPWEKADLTLRNKEVVIDKACGLAVLRGSPVFAPGVKGMQPDIREGTEVSVFADVSNKCKRGFPREFVESSKTFVGNGIVKMDRHRLFNDKNLPYGTAIEIIDVKSQVCGIKLQSDSGILQNLPSIVCGHVVGLNDDEDLTVLDMCAAPGNKTTHLAALMKNKGLVIAIDKSKKKVEKINELCEHLSIKNVKTFLFDSRKSIDGFKTERCVSEGPPFAPECFDRVLLDAPCSGLGQRPIFDNKITQNEIESFPFIQKQLFAVAVQHVCVGGYIIYSTCTITYAENEGLVKWALLRFPQIKLVPAEPLIGKSSTVDSGLSQEECQMVQKFGPPAGGSPESDTIGFFIAKFEKISSVLS